MAPLSVPWAIKKGLCFQEAAEAFKLHHRQDNNSFSRDYHFILIRNEITKLVFQGPLHLHKDDEVQAQDRPLAVMRDPANGTGIYPHPLCKTQCNWDAEMHKCSTASVTFSAP